MSRVISGDEVGRSSVELNLVEGRSQREPVVRSLSHRGCGLLDSDSLLPW